MSDGHYISGTPASALLPLLAKNLMLARGSLAQAASMIESQRGPTRLVDACKGLIAAATTGGGPGLDYGIVVSGFLDSLRGESVFYRAEADGAFRRIPPRTRAGILSGNLSASLVSEGMAIPLNPLSYALPTLEPEKVAALIVATAELVGSPESEATAWLSRELRNAVAPTVDGRLLDKLLTATGTVFPGTGSTVDAMRADLLAALDALARPGSRLYWAASQGVANRLAVHQDVFPGATPAGGELVGAPMFVSSGVTAGSLALIDASRVAAWRGSVDIDVSTEAALQMDDTPTNDSTTPTSLVSLWQVNALALKVVAEFAVEPLEAVTAVEISGFGGAS